MQYANPNNFHRRLLSAAAVAALFVVIPALHVSAETYMVASVSELQSTLIDASAGDTIIVQDGTYTTTSSIAVTRSGSAANPITIRTETIGGVTIEGTHGFAFSGRAAYIEVRGFRFLHANSINIPSSTHHIRLMRNYIDLDIPSGTDRSYINISGNDVEIGFNELANKSTLGNMLDITGSGGQVARRLWVHHNYFHDFVSPGGNGAETIRWGLSGLSLSTGDGLCEYNLFVRCNGENEMISNKSSGNVFRYNTVLDSAEISQRHGDYCEYYGNYMRNSEGIRIYGDSHLVHSNYLEGNIKGINIGNGDGDVHAGDALTSHDRPDDCVIIFNTLIDNDTQFMMNGRTGGLGATSTTFANNIIQGGDTAVSISSTAPYTNPTWAGNIIWNAGNIGNIPAGGYSNIDPKLTLDGVGVLHLASGSPALESAVGAYENVSFDMDGQPRANPRDIGADEMSGAVPTAWLLTEADVGPHAEIGAPTIDTEPLSQAITAGASVTLAIDVTASPGGPLTYQWRHDGEPIEGATSATYAIPSAQEYDAGTYSVVVTNSLGETVSNVVSLDISAPPPNDARVVNLSTRAQSLSGDDVLIPGFVISGTSSKRLLIRAVGASLGKDPFNLPDVLGNPRLSLKRREAEGYVDVGFNDDWQTNANVAEITSTIVSLGAFDLTDALDAALLVDLAPGEYSVVIDGAEGETGLAIAELYDADNSPVDARLANISCRGFAGAGDGVMIPGIVVSPEGPKTLLLRVVGPALGDLGVPDAMPDPKLTVYSGGTAILKNDDWSADPDAASTTAQVADQVGAFPLSDGSKDAAFVVTLAPGAYTVIGSSTDDLDTGVLLVEVYVVL